MEVPYASSNVLVLGDSAPPGPPVWRTSADGRSVRSSSRSSLDRSSHPMGERSVGQLLAELDEGAVLIDEIVDRPRVVGEYTGQVKWWNDRLGYGFATVSTGPYHGQDVFVHHTGIRPLRSNYRSLRRGEYVNFNITKGHRGKQAIDVTGINGGPLLCDLYSVNTRRGPPQTFQAGSGVLE